MARGRGPVSDLVSMTCRVDEVSGRTATVIDQFGIFRTVRTDVRRGMVRPREGEVWVIDRSLGLWTFAARVDDSEPPVVTGSTGNNPALRSLLEALEARGLITTETTNGVLDAAVSHTHSEYAPSGHTHG